MGRAKRKRYIDHIEFKTGALVSSGFSVGA